MSLLKQRLYLPFYAKLALVLISIIALGHICVLGKEILSPLIYSFLFAILLFPMANLLERRLHFARSLSSLVSVILMVVFIFLIVYFVGSQIASLAKDWPMFQQVYSSTINDFQHWVARTFHINVEKQASYVDSATSTILSSSTAIIGQTVASLSSILLFIVFIMIDTFFLLFYRRLIVSFLVAVFREENKSVVYDIITQVQFIINKYILGLLLEMAIVAAVCCIAFSLIGIRYAILLGLLTGLFNIIPYIGIFTALVLSALITIGTAATGTQLILVVGSIVGMHLVDSNVLLPMIVGSKVRINALITLLGVIIGEMLWGISGMFLSIPVIAICKIIFDRVESLQPWGILLGEEKKEPESLEEKMTDTVISKEPQVKLAAENIALPGDETKTAG